MIEDKETELSEMRIVGRTIYLLISAEDKLQRLDYFSKKTRSDHGSVSLIRVYFGKNKTHEEAYHHKTGFTY